MALPPILPWLTIYSTTGYEEPANSHKSLSELRDLALRLPAIIGSHWAELGECNDSVMAKITALVNAQSDSETGREIAARYIHGALIWHAAKNLGDEQTMREWEEFFAS